MIKKCLVVMIVGLVLVMTGCGEDKPTEDTQAGVSSPDDTTIGEGNEASDTTEDSETDETPDTEEDTEETAETDEDKNEDKEADDTEETAEEEVIEEIDLTGKAINRLSGVYIDEEVAARRPFGVMINSHKKAMPQSGIGQAEVLYETLTEGGICRLFAVFQDFDGEKIGPIRSARHYYLDFAFDHDAYYTHWGQSILADNAIEALNSPVLNAMYMAGYPALGGDVFYASSDRIAPHDKYTSYEGLMLGAKQKGYRKETSEDFANKFTFANEAVSNDGGMDAVKVSLDYMKPSILISYGWIDEQYAWFEYDTDKGQYLRFTFEEAHIDAETGQQLAFDNVIIQKTEMWRIKGDTEGRIDVALVGSGDGFYITKGKAVPITWEKASHYDPTVYYSEDGSVLEMNTGKTFISVFPSDTAATAWGSKLVIE